VTETRETLSARALEFRSRIIPAVDVGLFAQHQGMRKLLDTQSAAGGLGQV
jgi:hypothetical protein